MRFTKKPVTIEAMKFIGFLCDEANDIHMLAQFDDLDGRDADDGVLPDWLADALTKPANEPGAIYTHTKRSVTPWESTLRINTLEGHMTAQIGDFIIRGVEGELYPCKPDIFAKTYEPEQQFRPGQVVHLEPGSETITYPGDLPLCGQ